MSVCSLHKRIIWLKKTGNKSEYVEVDYVHDPFYDGLLSFLDKFDIPKTCQDIL